MIRNAALKIPSFSDGLGINTPVLSEAAGMDAEGAASRLDAMKRLLAGAAHSISKTRNIIAKSDTLEGRLSEKLVSLKRVAASVGMHLDADWRKRLFAKLDSMLALDEWEEENALPSEQSFSTFLRLIIYLHPTKRPGVGLSSKGHFLASWSSGEDRIVVECFADDDIRWVLSHTLEGHRESGAGRTKIYRLPDVIHAYNPDQLFADGHSLLI